MVVSFEGSSTLTKHWCRVFTDEWRGRGADSSLSDCPAGAKGKRTRARQRVADWSPDKASAAPLIHATRAPTQGTAFLSGTPAVTFNLQTWTSTIMCRRSYDTPQLPLCDGRDQLPDAPFGLSEHRGSLLAPLRCCLLILFSGLCVVSWLCVLRWIMSTASSHTCSEDQSFEKEEPADEGVHLAKYVILREIHLLLVMITVGSEVKVFEFHAHHGHESPGRLEVGRFRCVLRLGNDDAVMSHSSLLPRWRRKTAHHQGALARRTAHWEVDWALPP